jgi:DNA-binding NarL/FixJ family response regulator
MRSKGKLETQSPSQRFDRSARLSNREGQVIRLISRGLSNKEIACELGIAVTTVNQYVRTLLVKFSVRNRTQLAVKAITAGIRSVQL